VKQSQRQTRQVRLTSTRTSQHISLEPRDVEAAIDAYHAHLDRCLSFYAPDVVVKRADGTILMDGAEAVRARYAKSISDHPNLHYDVLNRIALGPYVVDEERVTGIPPADPR